MKSILLIGVSGLGEMLIKQLYEMGAQVMAVDRNEQIIEEVLPYVTDAKIGDATKEAFLRTLGVGNFDVCIVNIGKDFQSSLMASALLKELGGKLVVSRADQDAQAEFLLKIGADEVINPEKQLAQWAAIRYGSRHILDYLKLDEDHAIFEVPIPRDWVGKTVGKVDIRKKYGITIMALKENGKMDLSINPDSVLSPGKTMLVLGKLKSLQKCFHIS